jgi:hypothetical protein
LANFRFVIVAFSYQMLDDCFAYPDPTRAPS